MNTTTIESEAAKIDVLVGSRIRDRRKAKGMSQGELGARAGVTFQQIQKYERGTNRVSCSTLVLIARALECSPADIIGDGAIPEAARDDHADQLSDFLGSPYGPRMMRAFRRLSYNHAKHITDMTEMVAASDETLRESMREAVA